MKKDEKKIDIENKEKLAQPDYKDIRVFVAVPSTSMVHADFAMALATLGNHNTSINLRMALNNYKSADIAHARNIQVIKAQETKATHILFIDSDMGFKPWACQRLLDVMRDNHEKIVGVTVPKRVFPYHQVAKDEKSERLKIEMADPRGLVECELMGTGMVMIDMEVFKKVQFPYFEPYYKKNKEGKADPYERVSEDQSFFLKAKAEGFSPKIDIPLSKDTFHIGECKFDFTSEDFFADAIELRRQKAQEILNANIQEGIKNANKKKDDTKH